MLARRDLALEVSPAARRVIADAGHDPSFGARPLKRAVTTLLVDPLASAILAGGFSAGDTVGVDAEGDVLTFARVGAGAAAS
jgi:ATP-dependent Clp protease ATP-binding subunit ClpA